MKKTRHRRVFFYTRCNCAVKIYGSRSERHHLRVRLGGGGDGGDVQHGAFALIGVTGLLLHCGVYLHPLLVLILLQPFAAAHQGQELHILVAAHHGEASRAVHALELLEWHISALKDTSTPS